MYATAAQYNAPPSYPTTRICQGIDGATHATDILDRVFAGVVANSPLSRCHNTTPAVSQTSIGWGWQVSNFAYCIHNIKPTFFLTCFYFIMIV